MQIGVTRTREVVDPQQIAPNKSPCDVRTREKASSIADHEPATFCLDDLAKFLAIAARPVRSIAGYGKRLGRILRARVGPGLVTLEDDNILSGLERRTTIDPGIWNDPLFFYIKASGRPLKFEIFFWDHWR